jgi:hypothetical protein
MGKKKIFIFFILVLLALPGSVVQAEQILIPYEDAPIPFQVSVSPCGRYICAGGSDSHVIGLFFSNGTPAWNYYSEKNVTGCAVSENAGEIIFSTFDGDLFYLDNEGALIKTLFHIGNGSLVEYSDDGSSGYVFSKTTKGNPLHPTVYHMDSQRKTDWDLYIPALSSAAITPDGKTAVVGTKIGGNSELIRLSSDGLIVWRYPASWWVNDVSLSDEGNIVAALQNDQLLVFNENGQLLSNIPLKYHGSSVGVSPDGTLILVGTQFLLTAYNQSGYALWYHRTEYRYEYITVSKLDQSILTSTGRSLQLFDKNGKQYWNYSANERIQSIAISRDSRTIAAGSDLGTVYILNFEGDGISFKPGLLPSSLLPGESGSLPASINKSTILPSPPKPASISDILVLVAIGCCALIIAMEKKK